MDNALDPSTVLLLILLAGAFGGVAELLRECDYQSGMITLYGSQCNASSSLVIMLIASAIIGAAGAMGIQFIFVLLKSTRSRTHARKPSIRRSAEIGAVSSRHGLAVPVAPLAPKVALRWR
jgi:hypothetical protein